MLEERLKEARERLIIDLPICDLDIIGDIVNRLSPYAAMFRVGPELILKEGLKPVIEAISSNCGAIFLDLKLNDTSSNVVFAVIEATKYEAVKIISIQSSSGRNSMEAAVLTKKSAKIFVSTIHQSMSEKECEYTFGTNKSHAALRLAKESWYPKCDGIICSPEELRSFNQHSDLWKMEHLVYGVEPSFGEKKKNKANRPIDVIPGSTNYILVGSPIIEPANMTQEEAILKTLEEISFGLRYC